MDYKKAINQIVDERKAALADARILFLDLLRSDPTLYETEKQIRKLRIVLAENYDEESKKNLERLILQKSEILKAKGITAEMLDPPPKCSKCGDTGLVNGKPCSCVISRCVTDSSVIGFGFEDCDFAIFPDEERDRITDVYKTAKGFCDKFPTTKKLNFIFMGKCGSGKTFAASCMAKAISDKGYSVIMLSSFAFANRMLKYHVALSGEKLQYLEPLLDCDLLVIDDLGSENIIKNVTVEYLFHVINERMSAKKHTVITTNLDAIMLRERYGERTYSRLFGSLSFGSALSDVDLRNK